MTPLKCMPTLSHGYPQPEHLERDHAGCPCMRSPLSYPFRSFNTWILYCLLARLRAQVSMGCRFAMPPPHPTASPLEWESLLHAEEVVKPVTAGQDLLCVTLADFLQCRCP